VAIEAKSDESPGGPISLTTVRQAKTHAAWVRANCSVSSTAEVITVVTSPRTTVARDAQQHADGLFFLPLDQVRQIAKNLVAVLRRARAQAEKTARDLLIERLCDDLRQHGLLPSQVLQTLMGMPLSSLHST
jgi:hypothetical protein